MSVTKVSSVQVLWPGFLVFSRRGQELHSTVGRPEAGLPCLAWSRGEQARLQGQQGSFWGPRVWLACDPLRSDRITVPALPRGRAAGRPAGRLRGWEPCPPRPVCWCRKPLPSSIRFPRIPPEGDPGSRGGLAVHLGSLPPEEPGARGGPVRCCRPGGGQVVRV